jgi:hypothetical protein
MRTRQLYDLVAVLDAHVHATDMQDLADRLGCSYSSARQLVRQRHLGRLPRKVHKNSANRPDKVVAAVDMARAMNITHACHALKLTVPVGVTLAGTRQGRGQRLQKRGFVAVHLRVHRQHYPLSVAAKDVCGVTGA